MYINAIGQIYLLSLKAFTLAVTAPVGPACIKWASDGASKSGGERGIRTLDTLPYTHFPGVRLRPLGQLSVGAQSTTANPTVRHVMALKRGAYLDTEVILLRKIEAR